MFTESNMEKAISFGGPMLHFLSLFNLNQFWMPGIHFIGCSRSQIRQFASEDRCFNFLILFQPLTPLKCLKHMLLHQKYQIWPIVVNKSSTSILDALNLLYRMVMESNTEEIISFGGTTLPFFKSLLTVETFLVP